MNEKLPSREQAIQLLIENRCSAQVIRHCKAVAKLALETGQVLKKKGHNIDLDIIEVGALLHDIGRSKTHSVDHVVAGAEIARAAGLHSSLISIIKTHVGGGIDDAEAAELGWPNDDVYVPVTLEEKIVSYADKLIEGSRRVPITKTIEQLKRDLKPEAAERVRKISEEITALVGDKHD